MEPKRLAAFGLVLAMTVGLAPYGSTTTGDGVGPADLTERYVPRPPGVERDMRFFFGPFTIPPGQDNNRVTLDVPLHNGFFTAIAPNLVDAATGEEPSDLNMHIHHAHWFRISTDPEDEYYSVGGVNALGWIFGTGEEKTQGSINARSDAQPGGPRYGIFVPGGQPQTLIFMLHNKMSQAQTAYILLEVTFVYGTEPQIAEATDCGPLFDEDEEDCRAGADFEEIKGHLWGTTFDVPRQAAGDGLYVHPVDAPGGNPLGKSYTVGHSGTAIATAGHLHPNGMEVRIANIGPPGSACEADLDGDDFPGVTLLASRKLEGVAAAFPFSEDYQMGVSKFGWRAPVREGDRITQFGLYDNDEHASYGAMSYAGFYVDRVDPALEPGTRSASECTLAALEPTLEDDPLGDPKESMLNHALEDPLPLCALPASPGLAGYPPCDRPEVERPTGLSVDTVHISAFAYLPGDLGLPGMAGAPPRVLEGKALRFVNEDMALGVRHSVTSCDWPCNGPYVANYPHPNGLFDSDALGNLDPINGAPYDGAYYPVWSTPPDLLAGKYAYYCRIHPWMRGAFEVV